MFFDYLTKFSPSENFYNLSDKLINHVAEKSFLAFERADKKRNEVKTKEEFELYKEEAKKAFMKITGDVPYDKTLPLDAKIIKSLETETLTIEEIIFTSRKGIYVTCTLYLPKERKGKVPGILMQMGHSETGRLAGNYQKIAMMHAERGFAVLAIDPIGQGERVSYIDHDGSFIVEPTVPEHQYFGNQCFLTGNYPVRYFICDAMRAIDYMESREEIDSEKIGATGNSGGGTMTATLMAYDERIKAASPSCFLTTRRAYYYSGGAQDAEQIWVNGSEYDFDHYELVSLFCPRPLLMLTTDSDFFPIEGTELLYKKSKEFYRLFDAESNLEICTDRSEHMYTINNAISSLKFFSKHFLNNTDDYIPKTPSPISVKEQYATKTGQVVTSFDDAKIIFDENLSDYLAAPVKSIEEKRDFLLKKIYNNRRETKFYLKRLDQLDMNDDGKVAGMGLFWYSQPNMPCYAVSLTTIENKNKKLPVKLCLFDNGTYDIKKNEGVIRKYCDEGFNVIIPDFSGMGKCEPYDLNTERERRGWYGSIEKMSKDLIFLGDSLCALRLFDLLRTVKLIREELKIDDISFFASNMASIYGRILEFLDGEISGEFEKEISVHDIVTTKLYDSYNISGFIMPELALFMK